MSDMYFAMKPLNIEALDENLRTNLGSKVTGVSTGPYGICIHLQGEVTPEDTATVITVVNSHDPAVLTAKQLAALADKANLEAARIEADKVVVDVNADTVTLAKKVIWLEQAVINKGV